MTPADVRELVERLREAGKPYFTAGDLRSLLPDYVFSSKEWYAPDAPLMREAAAALESLLADRERLERDLKWARMDPDERDAWNR